jgi:hypothetical protein
MIRTILVFLVLLKAALTCKAETQALPPPPQPTAANVATYFVIPIKGGIGNDFTAARMKMLLQQAITLSPTVIVLEIDTGGGSVQDAERIIDLIIANKNLRFVALVRRALSAGAAITLACKEIYLTESATIGGAVSYRLGDDGNPVQLQADVAEKFQSIWRAVCRKAAEYGDHPSLIAEAMVDPDFSLTIRKEGEKVIIERNGRGELLKANNRILTLTAREAVSCGLAKGIVADMDALGNKLSMSGWQVLGQRSVADVESGNAKAESSPGYLYSVLFSKAVSLKLTEDQTSIQEQSAKAEWDAWLKKQSFQRRSVRWTLRLIEARDRRGQTYFRGYDDNGRLMGYFPKSGKLTDILRDDLKSAQNSLNDAADELEKYRSTPYLRSNVPNATKRVQGCLQKVSRVSRLLAEAEACPIEAFATCPEEPSLLVVAFVSKTSKDALAQVSPGNEITLSGYIDTLAFEIPKDRTFLVVIHLDQCILVPEGGIPVDAKTVPQDSNSKSKAAGQLNLARAFLRNGLTEKASTILRSILSEFPGTPEAEQAQKELNDIEQASKD